MEDQGSIKQIYKRRREIKWKKRCFVFLNLEPFVINPSGCQFFENRWVTGSFRRVNEPDLIPVSKSGNFLVFNIRVHTD